MSANARRQRVSELVNRFTLPLAAAGLAGGLIARLSGLHARLPSRGQRQQPWHCCR